jgi:hypothetical protein
MDVLIILRLTPLRERFQCPPKGGHTIRNVTRLVLRHSELDVAEHKLTIQFRGLGVIHSGIGEFVHDEQNYFKKIRWIEKQLGKDDAYLVPGGNRYQDHSGSA